MANQSGPFSDYLTQSAQPHTPQPTGLENNATSIAYIGSKFLEGLRRGRMERAALAEMENAKTQKAYEQLFHFADQAKDVDPEIKRQVLTPAIQGYLGHIAGVKETSKDTGHHFTDWVKSMATNLTGGQLPKAKAPLDMGLVGNAFAALNDPNNKIQNRWLQLSNGLRQAAKGNGALTQEAVYGLPEYQQWNAYRQANNLEGGDEWIGLMPKNTIELNQQKLRGAAFNDPRFQSLLNPGQQAVGGATAQPLTGMSPSDVGAEAPVTGSQAIPSTQPPPAQASKPSGDLFSAIDARQTQDTKDKYLTSLAGVQLPPGEPIPKLGNQEPVVTKDGQRTQAVYLPNDFMGFKAGFYDVNSRQHLPGASQATKLNPESANKVLTPEQISKYNLELGSQLDQAVTDPNLNKAAKSAIAANLTSNDLKGAGDILTRYVQMQQTQKAMEQARAIASENRAESMNLRKSGAATELAKNFLGSDEAKKMGVADAYARNAQDAFAAIQAGKDPGIYDLELLRTWAKLTDIMTGVREGEYRDLASAMGRLRDAGVAIENLMDATGARIDPKMRGEVLGAITRMRDNQYNAFESKRKLYEEQLSQSDLGSSPLLKNTYQKPGSGSAPAGNVQVRPDAPGRRPGASAAPPAVAKQAGSASPALREDAPARKRIVPKL